MRGLSPGSGFQNDRSTLAGLLISWRARSRLTIGCSCRGGVSVVGATPVAAESGRWQVRCADGSEETFDVVVNIPPSPQPMARRMDWCDGAPTLYAQKVTTQEATARTIRGIFSATNRNRSRRNRRNLSPPPPGKLNAL